MIHSIFLYQSHTGLLIYDKSFQDISVGKIEMFSSFFSAIKAFISELVLEESLDRSKELTSIELKDYTVLVTSLPKVKVDMVIIADKEDSKSVNKVIPKLIKLLNKYEQLFLSWDGNKDEFSILDHPLTEKLKDETTFLKYQNEVNKLKNEIKDVKFKLSYYLEKTRASLIDAIDNLGEKPIHQGDYKRIYLNLYSFSTKLKLIKENGWEIYRELASKLIDKESLSDHDLSELIQNLLKMSSNIEDYLN